GPTAGLRDHVAAIVSGHEVVVTALKFDVIARAAGPGKYVDRKVERWATLEAVSSGRLMRGREWPVWRGKARLKLPDYTYRLVHDSLLRGADHIVGERPPRPGDGPALTRALGHEDARVRIDAADDLGLIGPPAADAMPALRKLMEEDADPLARIAGAKALAAIDPKNETAIPVLVKALKDDTGKVR